MVAHDLHRSYRADVFAAPAVFETVAYLYMTRFSCLAMAQNYTRNGVFRSMYTAGRWTLVDIRVGHVLQISAGARSENIRNSLVCERKSDGNKKV